MNTSFMKNSNMIAILAIAEIRDMAQQAHKYISRKTHFQNRSAGQRRRFAKQGDMK